MGTIVARPRRDRTVAYMAQIAIKRDGFAAVRETRTFDRKAAAETWIRNREGELAEPGALAGAATRRKATLGDAIERYIADSRSKIGKTKRQVLAAIKGHALSEKPCERIASVDIVDWAKELRGRMQPQTVANYFSHLRAVFAVARPAWGYALDAQAIADAAQVTQRLGLTGKSRHRQRRPTLDELDRLMAHFGAARRRRPASAPMQAIVAFALFSTRRQEEITRIAWADLDREGSRILVRDMKHPGQRVGNDQWCDLPPEALRIALSMPQTGEAIFPFTTDAIGAAFTRACDFLEIEDLRFHDLRHEGVSRLFETGRTIPQAAAVSGHRSWSSLKRYAHLRQTGDKYAGWPWLDVIAPREGS